MTHQTNAQRLADVLDHFGASGSASKEAATELRRLSAIEQERDQLRAQLAALKDGQADPVGTVFTMEALGTPGRPMTETQKLRADFEAWWDGELEDHNGHPTVASLHAWGAWQAAAVKYAPPQAQQPIAGPLFCDMKTDADKANFFLSGRGYETGVIAKAVQNDVAMAYQRCANYAKQSQQPQAQRGASDA